MFVYQGGTDGLKTVNSDYEKQCMHLSSGESTVLCISDHFSVLGL